MEHFARSEKLVTQELWQARGWVNQEMFDEGRRLMVYARSGFPLSEEVQKRKKALEVAGPTAGGYRFHETDPVVGPRRIDLSFGKKLIVSNLYPGVPNFLPGKQGTIEGGANLITDSRALSVKEGAVDIVYCSCLGEIHPAGVRDLEESEYATEVPRQEKERARTLGGENILERNLKLREDALREVWRILPLGGMLVWQGGKVHDVGVACELGFTILQREEVFYNDGLSSTHNLVFIKEQARNK